MIQKILLGILILPLVFILKDHQGLGKKVDREIKDEFHISSYEYKGVEISEALSRKLPSRITKENFFMLKNDESLIGYAYLDKAPSKTAEFDYLVIFDEDLSIARTKVMVYREEYGGEIGSKRWLRQFTGKSKASELQNIAAISGATISVRSMKSAVKDLLDSVGILKKNDVL